MKEIERRQESTSTTFPSETGDSFELGMQRPALDGVGIRPRMEKLLEIIRARSSRGRAAAETQ